MKEFLEAWLARTGSNQAQLSRASGVPQNVISRWLGDAPPRPSLKNLAKLAPAVGVPYEDLLSLCGYLPGPLSPQPDQRRQVMHETLDAWLNAVGAAYEAFFWQALTIQAQLVTDLIRGISRAALGLEQQPAEHAISTSEIGPLACSCLFCRPDEPGEAGGPGDTLAILLALPLAG